jgi:hypothetical protein
LSCAELSLEHELLKKTHPYCSEFYDTSASFDYPVNVGTCMNFSSHGHAHEASSSGSNCVNQTKVSELTEELAEVR